MKSTIESQELAETVVSITIWGEYVLSTRGMSDCVLGCNLLSRQGDPYHARINGLCGNGANYMKMNMKECGVA